MWLWLVHTVAVVLGYAVLAAVVVGGAVFLKHKLTPKPRPTPLAPLPTGKVRHVVITGCDTGFGHDAAIRIADTPGFQVHALCLTAEGVAVLRAATNPRLNPIQCDVTSDDDVARAVQEVQQHTYSLWALVNNAGIGGGSTLEFIPPSVHARVMDVNYMGSVRVAKAFMLMLHASKTSRMIQMSSAAARCAIGGAGPYCASKHAVTAWATTFAVENKCWGVDVSILEPNNMKTPMLEAVPRHMAQTFDSLSPDTKAKYGEAFFQARLFVAQKKYQTAADPTQVVDAMVNAVVMHEPLPLRNAIGPNYGGLTKLTWMPYSTQFEAMHGMYMGPGAPAACVDESDAQAHPKKA